MPEASFGRDAVFVSLPLLVASEDYRDGLAVPQLGVTQGADGGPAEARPFASFRLYARSLDDVAPLARHLRAENLEIVTRSSEIETVRAIDRVLTFVFVVLASIGVTGYLLSLAASLWANVDRKRKEIALLRLVGFGTANIVAFPAIQALMLASAGIAVSAAIYWVVATAFNAAFINQLNRDEFVCRLSAGDAAAAVAMTVALALLASMVGGVRAATVEPAEGLRAL